MHSTLSIILGRESAAQFQEEARAARGGLIF